MLQFGNESLGKGIDDYGKNHGRGCVIEILTKPMKYKHWLETFKVNEQKQEEDAEQNKILECAFDELMKITSLANFFHTSDKQSYADINVKEHKETYSLNSKNFKHWLNNQFFLKFNQIPSDYEMAKVLNALEGKALFQGECREIHNRLAFHDDKIYIDLGCPDWKVVEVSSSGWKIVSEYPVRFKRSQNQQSLPIPTRNGNVNELREIVNFNDADWVLILCWLSFCYYPKYPHPILILNGEQGSGKSFTSSG